MSFQREAIYAANFALLKTVTGVATFSRILKHWTDVPPEQCPAIFQAQTRESQRTPVPGLDTEVRLRADLYIYVKTTGDQVPGTVVNPILDQLQALYFPSDAMTSKQTLGGLVRHARIEGEIVNSEGTLGTTEVVIVPLEFFVTSEQTSGY